MPFPAWPNLFPDIETSTPADIGSFLPFGDAAQSAEQRVLPCIFPDNRGESGSRMTAPTAIC
jgi:hypothetical protein